MKIDEFDAVECNEAFAAIALMWQKEFDYPMERFNPRGGAIAIGHPLGASGVAPDDHACSATSRRPAAATASRRCAKAAARPTPPSSSASNPNQRLS